MKRKPQYKLPPERIHLTLDKVTATIHKFGLTYHLESAKICKSGAALTIYRRR